MAFGLTGQFPNGKLNDDDEGERIFGVAPDPEHHVVVLSFGSAVSWVGLPPDTAEQLAYNLIKAAQEVKSAH